MLWNQQHGYCPTSLIKHIYYVIDEPVGRLKSAGNCHRQIGQVVIGLDSGKGISQPLWKSMTLRSCGIVFTIKAAYNPPILAENYGIASTIIYNVSNILHLHLISIYMEMGISNKTCSSPREHSFLLLLLLIPLIVISSHI